MYISTALSFFLPKLCGVVWGKLHGHSSSSTLFLAVFFSSSKAASKFCCVVWGRNKVFSNCSRLSRSDGLMACLFSKDQIHSPGCFCNWHSGIASYLPIYSTPGWLVYYRAHEQDIQCNINVHDFRLYFEGWKFEKCKPPRPKLSQLQPTKVNPKITLGCMKHPCGSGTCYRPC